MIADLLNIPNPIMAFVLGVIATGAAVYYGVWWLALFLLVYTVLTGIYMFRRARKIYREGTWQPN